MTDHLAGGINDAFPHKVCINLDRRSARWQRMRHKFEQHGIHAVQRFAALDGDDLKIPAHWTHTPGAYGCLRSHVEVVRDARRRGAANVLIFEDDVVFDPEFQAKFAARIAQLPPDWDMLFFGALHKDEPLAVTDNLVRLTRSNSTYAYALRETVFDAFIELNSRAEDVLDNNNFALQQRFNCYCFMPHLAWVETGYSDAQRRLERHWYLQESLVLFSTRVDRLLSDTTLVFAHKVHAEDGRRATENLLYLVDYYHDFFSPHLAIVIVEQGARPHVNAATLPANCQYIFLRDDAPFNRERCFQAGIAGSDAGRNFFILSDNDIYLETLDIRANLLMCERYGGATGFDEIVDLTDEDSQQLLRTKTTRGIDITKYAARENNRRRGYCRFFKREALSAIARFGELDEAELEKERLVFSSQGARVFQSPNHALRLRD